MRPAKFNGQLIDYAAAELMLAHRAGFRPGTRRKI